LQRIIGSLNNAAVRTALAQANGIQALDHSRKVVALCGDGGFSMLMSEFLTAVHHRLPVKVVVYNNSAFGLIPLEAEAVGLPPYREGIEFPNPDFAALARACGGHALRATKPGEPHAEINAALKVDGPAIVDCVWQPRRCPTFRISTWRRSGTTQWQRSRKRRLQLQGRDTAAVTRRRTHPGSASKVPSRVDYGVMRDASTERDASLRSTPGASVAYFC
jgi:TPP-dependent trihydroxycyclohexane-1,2-dione (THcHDO) dehydratase